MSVPGGLANVTFSSDGRLVASVDPEKKRILLWSGTSLSLIREFSGQGVLPGALAFSPDRKTLASDGDDRMVKLWDVETGEQLVTLEKYGSSVLHPCFSSDGKTLATSGGLFGGLPEILLWRTANLEPTE